MTDRAAETAAPPTKNLGDYGVEVDKALANNNTGGVPPIVAEMRAAVPPEEVEAREAKERDRREGKEVEAPPPENLGLAGFADALATAAESNNVVEARKLAADMQAVEPPKEPGKVAPAGDPPVGQIAEPRAG